VTDVIFAVDSVPAIFALTEEPLIVLTSNVFAILGLRSMYSLLAGTVDRFHLLRYGLALVLVFVGLKMVWDLYFTDPPFGLPHAFGPTNRSCLARCLTTETGGSGLATRAGSSSTGSDHPHVGGRHP
jgi:hypothetical protein